MPENIMGENPNILKLKNKQKKTLKVLKCSLAGSVFPVISVLLTGMTEKNVLLTLILQVETMHYAFCLEVQVASNTLSFSV